SECAFQIGGVDLDLGDLGLLDLFQDRWSDLAPGMNDFLAFVVDDPVRQLHAGQVCRAVDPRLQRPVQLAVLQGNAVDRVERPQNVFIAAQTKGPQENRSQEL